MFSPFVLWIYNLIIKSIIYSVIYSTCTLKFIILFLHPILFNHLFLDLYRFQIEIEIWAWHQRVKKIEISDEAVGWKN